MSSPPPLSRVPAHLACAVTIFAFVALGSGACDRTTESGQGDAKAPPSAHAEAGPDSGTRHPKGGPQAGSPTAPPAAPAAAKVAPAPQEPAKAPAPSRRYVIAALGDSITDKRSRGGGFLDYVAARCPESVIDNYGKGGDMVNQMRTRFENEVLPVAKQRGYTHLVMLGGVNDLYSNLTAGRTNERIEGDLSTIYAEARLYGMAVVAFTVAPWGGFKKYFNPERAENTRQLNAWIFSQVPQKSVERVVDAYGLLSCGDAERLCPEFEPPFHDGIHPGTKGHEVLGKALFETAFADCR